MAELLTPGVVVLSILLRVGAAGYAARMVSRTRDYRFGILAVLLGVMAVRQAVTVLIGTPDVGEIPALLASVLALAALYYLSQYVADEDHAKLQLSDEISYLRRFHRAIQHAADGIFITDGEGTIEYANPAIETVTGFPRNEVLGKTPRLGETDEDGTDFSESVFETLEDGEQWSGELAIEQESGDKRWLDMTIAPITNERGDVDEFVGVDRDVTERKEREFELQERVDEQGAKLEVSQLLQELYRDVIDADDRDEIEQVVCETLVRPDRFSYVWTADRDEISESLSARAVAGIERDTLETLVESHNYSSSEDIVSQAIRTESTHVRQNLNPAAEEVWIRGLSERGYHAVATFPLLDDGDMHGVVEIVATEDFSFDVLDEATLTEVGRTIGRAIGQVKQE